MQFVERLLEYKPLVVDAYFKTGLHITYFTTKALGAYMKHLLLVKGLDPNTVPGEKARKEMAQALDSAFTYRHESTFDTDFDFSWLHKKWEETAKKLKDLNLSEKEFTAITDLSRVQDAPAQEAGDPLTVGQVDLDEENFGSVHPSALELPVRDERARDKKLDEAALARLRELEKMLDDEMPFNPQIDLPGLVQRGEQLKEISRVIKGAQSRVRKASKFKGNFTRGK